MTNVTGDTVKFCWQHSSVLHNLHPLSVAFATFCQLSLRYLSEVARYIQFCLLVDIKPEIHIAFSRVYENRRSKLAKRTKLRVIWVLSDCPIVWTPFVFLLDRMAFIWPYDFQSTERECIRVD